MSIVVAYEPTPEAEAALVAAIEETSRRGGTLLIAHVVTTTVSEGRPPAKRTADGRQRAEEFVAAAVERATEAGVEAQARLLSSQTGTASALIELAQEQRVELIVTGMRQRSAVGKLLMGSTSRDLILGAPCNVLCVRPPS